MNRSVITVLLALCAAPVLAQQAPRTPPPEASIAAGAVTALPFEIDGPPPPVPPATIVRDEQGRVTIRAVRLAQSLKIDGALDEELYRTSPPFSDFIQNEPAHGQPATEKTEVWVSFDRNNVYVSVRASESRPDRMIVNEMRRDSFQVIQNENFAFMFDTFYDRRNAFGFQFTPLGGRMDGQFTNESAYNGDFNPVWNLAVRRGPDGWTGEAAVPFKSLRFRPGTTQVWGFGARRINRWKNEISYLTPMPAGYGIRGTQIASRYATLVGIEAPSGSRTLDIKPYAVSDLTTDLPGGVRNKPGGEVGLDLRYGITQNLAADVTVNTDFAQVEADDQQVNLTRFSLFFPEKREFFLENQGLFQFGGIGGGGGPGGGNTATAPVLFYSRRIGLDQGRVIPLQAGGRVSGRVGPFSVGVLNIQTGDNETARTGSGNFAVARIRRDILRKSSIGAMVTRRSQMVSGAGSNDAYGVDGRFAFFENLAFNTYWARTRTPGLNGDDQSYRVQLDYNADRYGLQLEHLRVGDNFVPDIGFVRRDDMRRHYAQARFSPRPRSLRQVRKFSWTGSLEYIENGAGVVETREASAEFQTEFQNSDRLELSYTDGYEFLELPFGIARGVTIPTGGYGLTTARAAWTFGQQRLASGTWFVERGAFYEGHRTAFGYSGARVKISPQLSIEPGVSVNRVRLPFGDFTTRLVSSRTTFTVTPLMFLSGLVQYNSSNSSLGANVRFRWEYQPGSELFVVYNEGRDTTRAGYPDLQSRAVVVKINRLLRF
jgi:hypothetical protein